MGWRTWTWSAMAGQPLQQEGDGSPTALAFLWPSSLEVTTRTGVMAGVHHVSQWLGHRSVNTTMIYAHLAPQDDQINVLS